VSASRPACRVGALVLSALFVLVPHALAGQTAAPPSRTFVLPNGMRVFLYEKRGYPLVNIALAVDAGSKDETDATSGLAHLLEHCILFRGTAERSAAEVERDVRGHGAYFNANTGQDLTVFEISLPSEFADFALRNQREILFGFALAPEALEEEKAVVLEEMNQMEDDPRRRGTDLALQRLFEGHPYGRPVYGRPEVLRSARVEDLKAFHDRYFVPDNCALAVTGDFAVPEMEAKVREVFGPLAGSGRARAALARVPLLEKSVSLREERDVKDAYLILGFVGPDFNHPDRYAMDLLAEALGRGVNPLLNMALRSRRDLVQNVQMSYFPGRYGGAVVIVLTLDPKNVAAATREALTYLRKARDESFSADDFYGEDKYRVLDHLGSAKNRIRFSSEQAEESGLALASSIARFMLLNERENPGPYVGHIDRTTSGDLRKAAGRYFGRGEFVAVAIVPKKSPSKPGGGGR
jgi:zinc protease